MSVLSKDWLENKLDVLDTLRFVPGGQIVQAGQRGGQTSFFIRGGNSNADKVLLDGIPMNEIGGVADLGPQATTSGEQIEVLRGPNSSLYVADTISGGASLTTRPGTTPMPQIS